MPGSKEEPVVLDQYHTIVEVGWPGVICVSVWVYKWSFDSGLAGPTACNPSVVVLQEFMAGAWSTRAHFSFYNQEDPEEIEENVNILRAAWKWKSLSKEEQENAAQQTDQDKKDRKGKWETMDADMFDVEKAPQDIQVDTTWDAWAMFEAYFRWEDIAGDATVNGKPAKYFVPEQPPDEPDIFFKMTKAKKVKTVFEPFLGLIPITAGNICYGDSGTLGGDGLILGVTPDPRYESNQSHSERASYNFTDTIFKFQTDKKDKNGKTIIDLYKPIGIQVTPTPRPILTPETEYDENEFVPIAGPAKIYLLCSRAGKANDDESTA